MPRSADNPVTSYVDQQRLRRITQGVFFVLFVLAPLFDLLRLDLQLGHFIFFGMDWTLGLDALTKGEITPLEAGGNIVLRGFVPIAGIIGTVLWVSFFYGRVYCGWVCPHFSVVETLNGLTRRAIGKHSIWDAEPLPLQDKGAVHLRRHPGWWAVFLSLALFFAFLWSTVLLTYLLPPMEVFSNLWHGELTRNQALFIGVGTGMFLIEFTLARHLFCRFGCAAGLFQSLAWMANRMALVVGFDRTLSRACQDCTNACDNACPMRLKPRTIKRHMLSCTQCASCIDACRKAQKTGFHGIPLKWRGGIAALDKSDRESARRSEAHRRILPLKET